MYFRRFEKNSTNWKQKLPMVAMVFFYGILKIQIINIKTVTVPNFDHALFELYNNPTAQQINQTLQTVFASIFFTYLPESKIQKRFQFIQKNSFIIVTCPNPDLLVQDFGHVGQYEDCTDFINKLSPFCPKVNLTNDNAAQTI